MQIDQKIGDLFSSAKSVYIALASYTHQVGQEIGTKKAMEILSNTFHDMGNFQGSKLKRLTDQENMNAKEAYDLIKTIPKSMGINFMITTKQEDKVIARLDKCPIYESAKIVGIDPSIFCTNTAMMYFDAIAKKLNPGLEYQRNKVKTSESDFCEEQLILKK